MASFHFLGLSSLPGRAETLLHGAVLHAYAPPLAAVSVAVALGLIGRAGRRPLLAAAGAGGALAGWAALLPMAAVFQALLAPRAVPDVLLLPALAATLAGLARSWLGERARRWEVVALIVLAGWWLARSVPARAEFWRVWLAVGLVAWLLTRALGQPAQGGRMLAAALALWGGLIVAAAPPVWIAAALAAAAAALGAWCLGAALPPVLVATVLAATVLGAGRLVRGGVNATDLACVLALGAAWLAPWIEVRLGRRLGPAGPAVAALGTAVLAATAVWLGRRLLQK